MEHTRDTDVRGVEGGRHAPLPSAGALRRRRGQDAATFIAYLCRASALRSAEKRGQRMQTAFVAHCQELYEAQKGLCAVSGVPLTFGSAARQPRQISIDRIDHARGYEVGNVRLVAWWINNARGSMDDKVLAFFAHRIAGRYACVDEEDVWPA